MAFNALTEPLHRGLLSRAALDDGRRVAAPHH
jgi:hypothetical protein